jgi:hypothetical protein
MDFSPIDYSIQVADPFLRSLQGVEIGQKLGGMIREAREAPILAEQAAAKRQAIMDFVQNPNPMAADYSRALLLNPELEKPMKEGWTAMTAERKDSLFRSGIQVLSALEGGQAEIAKNLLRERAAAETNSNNPQQAQIFETYAKLVDVNPAALKQIIGLNLAAGDEEKFAENYERLKKLPGAVAEQEATVRKTFAEADIKEVEAAFAPVLQNLEVKGKQANIAQTNAQIQNIASAINDRASRLNLDANKLALDTANIMSQISERGTKIPEGALKIVNEAAINGASSKIESQTNLELANRIENANFSNVRGLGQVSNLLQRQLGFGADAAELRSTIERARNSAAVKSLPPGPATDKDIALFLAPIPDSFSNPKVLASYFRGLAKVQAIQGAVDSARADWMAQNKGSLAGKAMEDMEAGGYKVPKGQTFAQFSQAVVKAEAKKFAPTQNRTAARTRADQIIGGGSR